MAVVCLLCMVALLLVQDVQSRKLLWTEQEKKETHGGLGNHGGAAGQSTTLVSVSLNLPNYCTYYILVCNATCLSENGTSLLQQIKCTLYFASKYLGRFISESCLTVYIIYICHTTY